MQKLGMNLARDLNFDSFSSESGDYYSSNYFEPDVLLPSQFHEEKKNGLLGGERKLMSAMLSDGVQTYIEQALAYLNGDRGRVDAIEWIESKDQAYIFSFDNVCFSLGINPEYLRLGLAKLILESKRKRKELMTTKSKIESIASWKRIRRPRKV